MDWLNFLDRIPAGSSSSNQSAPPFPTPKTDISNFTASLVKARSGPQPSVAASHRVAWVTAISMKLNRLIATASLAFCLVSIPPVFGEVSSDVNEARVVVITQLNNRDARFLRTAAQGLLFEIQAGALAQTRTTTGSVLMFSRDMVNDHTEDLATLQARALELGVTLPTETDVRRQRILSRLARLSGAQFDREYIRVSIAEHRLSLRVYSGAVLLGVNFTVRQYAADRVPVLLAHLRLAYEVAVDIGLLPRVPGVIPDTVIGQATVDGARIRS